MAVEVLTCEPVCFTIGDTVSWVRFEADYLPPDWKLVYGFSGPTRFTIESIAEVDNHKTTMPTAGILPGDYVWTVRAVNDTLSQSITVGQGRMRAVPDLTVSDAELDAAETRLATLESAYNGLSNGGFTSVSVDGIAFSRGQTSDLKANLMFARREVKRLRANRQMLLGLGGDPLFLTRFRT
jgi:hypothetical protein